VQNYVAGNEEALSTLIKRHESRIYGFIYSKIADRDISNDIFQDTFIKVIKTLKSNSYNEEGKFYRGYAYHNLIIDHFRKTKKCYLEKQKNFQFFHNVR
jgi:RNA polymerase sigma-70 factor (ECF subfamily)